jgi:O-antigen/teichoic acid export membrane protein
VSEKDSFNKAILLTLARLFGVVFSFLIPVYLSRTLAIEEYGTYKQILLLYWFSQVALNLGVDDAAYYELRICPEKFPLFCTNALLFNIFVTSLAWVGLVVFQNPIANLLNNPELAQYLPWLGLLIFLTINSMQLEGILIGLNRFKERLALELTVELLKAMGILIAFIIWGEITYVLWALSLLMGIRLLMTLGIIHLNSQKLKLKYFEAFSTMGRQLRYGLPLGISRILQNIINLEKLLISSFYSVRDYTIYSVGSFENPFINAGQASFYELANLEMLDAVKKERLDLALQLWQNLIRKLSLIVVPFVCFTYFFAAEIITLVFSSRYVESILYFKIFNFFILVNALNPEPLFRCVSKTSQLLSIKTIGYLTLAVILLLTAYLATPAWVMISKILGIGLINSLCLVVGGSYLQAGLKSLFRWRELGLLLFLSMVLAWLFSVIFTQLSYHPFIVLAISFSLYVPLHFTLSTLIGLIKEDELAHLKNLVLSRFR